MIKSDSVRKRFIKILTGNIRNVLNKYDDQVAVIKHWDYIEVRTKDESKYPLLTELLQRIPGIHHFLQVEEKPFSTLQDIFQIVYEDIGDKWRTRHSAFV